MNVRRNHLLCCATAALAATASLAHGAGDTVVRALLGDGTWTRAQLVSIGDGTWRMADDASKEQVIRESDVIAFIVDRSRGAADASSESEVPSPISYGSLEFANGQRLPGNFRATRDANLWDHRWIGAIPVALEDMAVLRIRGANAPERRADADTVLLLNGDTITGFVDSIGESIVCETIDGAAGEATEKRSVSMDRAAAISFAIADAIPMRGSRFWTMDGSVVDGSDLRYDAADGWGFTLVNPKLAETRGKRTSDNNAANPVAAVFATARMTPMAAFGRPSVSVPAGQYHYGFEDSVRIAPADRAMLGLASIEIDGPVAARFTVPASARTDADACVFSCEIALRAPFPGDAKVDVEVRLGTATSRRSRLDAGTPREAVRLESAASGAEHLTIVIEDGCNGVVGDSVELRRANMISIRR